MRTAVVNILATCSGLITLFAGQLDVAVIQFPEQKSPAELQSAFARVNLFELTDADRTQTANAYLRGGYVLFAQRFRAVPGSSFSTSTRLKNASAQVTGRLNHASLALSIALTEGIKAGLRGFQKKVYTGSGPLPAGPARVLGVRQMRGRSPNFVKDQTRMRSYFLTTVVVAQYAP
jgi:hypothetical protein